MSDQAELRSFSLSGIAERCARETEHFFQRQAHDPRFCFELFRRAIAERCQGAWEAIYAQYSPQVAGWVGRHPAYPASGEEVQYFINRALEKMWAALTPAKFPRFPDLKSLLRYLQMCVHSVVLDNIRPHERANNAIRMERQPDGAGAESLDVQSEPGDRDLEEQALHREQRRTLWLEISVRLRNEKERHVVYGSFVLALKPRELYVLHPDTFRDVNEVYRVKENVLARLRRDRELAKLFGPHA